jgi:hypothetical protein
VLAKYPDEKNIRFVSFFVFGLFVFINFLLSDPRKNENYSTPTYLSLLIQSKASFLYNPPPEIFAERYSGIGESINNTNPRGILGPDCRKLLIYPGQERNNITIPQNCIENFFIDYDKLKTFADTLVNSNLNNGPFYAELDRKIFSSSPQYNLILNLLDFQFSTWGKAYFDTDQHVVKSDDFTDSALVTNQVTLPHGQYKLKLSLSYSVESENNRTNAAHVSVHGNKILIPINTSSKEKKPYEINLFRDEEPFQLSIGLGGWSKGRGFIKIDSLEIFSITRKDLDKVVEIPKDSTLKF